MTKRTCEHLEQNKDDLIRLGERHQRLKASFNFRIYNILEKALNRSDIEDLMKLKQAVDETVLFKDDGIEEVEEVLRKYEADIIRNRLECHL